MLRGGALVAERRGRAPVGGAKCMWAGPMACGQGQATVGGARGREVGPACPPLSGRPGMGNCSGDCPQDTLVPNCDVTYWSLWSPPIVDIPAGPSAPRGLTFPADTSGPCQGFGAELRQASPPPPTHLLLGWSSWGLLGVSGLSGSQAGLCLSGTYA